MTIAVGVLVIIGPVFFRELATSPRRARLYLYRSLHAGGLLVLMCTAWSVLTGTQVIRNIGDMARFGSLLFQVLAPLQLALVGFFAAMTAASAVAQEKDRRTLILLLMTRLNNGELVLGKLLASLLNVLVMLAAAVPLFILVMLFGGVSLIQVVRVFAVTFVAVLVAGSLGSTIALWREKTFQTLAMTGLVICFWLGWWEVVAAGVLGDRWFDLSTMLWAECFSPARAIVEAARPLDLGPRLPGGILPVWGFLITNLSLAAALCGIAVWRVRVWNPSREVRRPAVRGEDRPARIGSAVGEAGELSGESASLTVEAARAGHVDAQPHTAGVVADTREVWDNPILWREVRTWAHGRKVLVIRVAYLLLVVMAGIAVRQMTVDYRAISNVVDDTQVIPQAAVVLVPLYVISLLIINALAVTSVTTERDGKHLDLLLATDLSPSEFVFGKLLGVFSVAGLMVGLPLLLSGYLWWRGGVGPENLVYLLIGIAVLDLFVAMLGIHCGMAYANSRVAIGVSLGTVFFLCFGIAICIVMMVSFSGSFSYQLPPFLAFVLGGSVGLYLALGLRNPSQAIGVASFLVPFATFYAITSFLLHQNLSVFLVTTCTYGFTTAAMMVPALYEFDFAMGRTTIADE